MNFKIEHTPCFPNAFKVVFVGYAPNNGTHLYHPTREAAVSFASKFGGIEL